MKHVIPRRPPVLFGAKRKGKKVEITVGNEARIPATYVGHGRFSVAFHTNMWKQDEIYIFTFYEDFSKSIMAHAYREATNYLAMRIPELKRTANMIVRDDPENIQMCVIYRGEFIEHFNARKRPKRLTSLVEKLQEAHDDTRRLFRGDIVTPNKCDSFNQTLIAHCKTAKVPDELIYTLGMLAGVAQEWGDHYIFDSFHERNLGVKDGELYLLDPMFDMDKIQKDWAARKRAPWGFVDITGGSIYS